MTLKYKSASRQEQNATEHNDNVIMKKLQTKDKLTCRPKKRSADKFDSFDPSYCQFLIKL